MKLFFSLLPLYLFGNLHCIGMCGPLVMLIGQHRYRLFYFLGRLLSFSLAGLFAGELGLVLHTFLKQYHLAEIISLVCGVCMIGWGIQKMMKRGVKQISIINKVFPVRILNYWISILLLKDKGWTIFLFGFFTIALPCGQTLIVFSACALAGNAMVGLGNGFAFALLTTPSLMIAMHALTLFRKIKHYDRAIVGGCAIFIGLLACCRGLAEIEWIDHWIINPNASNFYHLVLF